MGKLAKTIAAPYKADRACHLAMRNTIQKALSGLERLEQAAQKKAVHLENHAGTERKNEGGTAKEAPPTNMPSVRPRATLARGFPSPDTRGPPVFGSPDRKGGYMQEEVNQKTIALSIRATKLTGRVLASALRKM